MEALNTTAIITVSDGVSAGTREDRSGEALTQLVEQAGFSVVIRDVVVDEIPAIEDSLRRAVAHARLVVTTGGTGFGPRDVTPEATERVIDRRAGGLEHLMFQTGIGATPMAALGRGLVGSAGTSLVVNLPGSPRGAVENLSALLDLVPHALELLVGHTEH